MTRESAIKASVILKEIDDLKKYNKMLSNEQLGMFAHFEFKQTYSYDSATIAIDAKHNRLLIPVLENIIIGLETELENLK